MTTTAATQKRYTVEPPPHAGSWFEKYGWTVRDNRPDFGPEFAIVMSGSKSDAQRWARDLNRRAH